MWRNQYGTIQGMLSQPRQYCRRNGSYVQCSWWNDTIRHKRQNGRNHRLVLSGNPATQFYLANIATNLLRPVIYIQTETVIVDERSLLIAHIAEGDNKPYKDLNGIIWTKQGADKRKVMENSEIMRLFQCSGILYADEQPIPFTSEKDINGYALDNFIRKEYGREKDSFGILYTELLHNLHIMKEDRMTLAGLLFFGKDPQQYRPTFVIKAVSFFGNDIGGINYRDSKDITGTLPELFEKGMSFLKANLHNIQAGQGFNSIGKLEISEVALEEILQNAWYIVIIRVMHR